MEWQLVFLNSRTSPLRFAIELHRKLTEYNQSKEEKNDLLLSIKVRIGIHGGPVFRLHDIRGNENIWGPGIVTARRIMEKLRRSGQEASPAHLHIFDVSSKSS